MYGKSARPPVSKYDGRVLILEVPRVIDGKMVEKGDVIFEFSETFVLEYKQLDAERLAKCFRVILEPSWVGYSLPGSLVSKRLTLEKVVVTVPYPPDHEPLESLESNLVPISLGPADSVYTSRFHKTPGIEKKYAEIYVANYNPKNRVDRLLRVVVEISHRRPDYRVDLICAGVGKSSNGQWLREPIKWAKSMTSVDSLDAVKQPRLIELFRKCGKALRRSTYTPAPTS